MKGPKNRSHHQKKLRQKYAKTNKKYYQILNFVTIDLLMFTLLLFYFKYTSLNYNFDFTLVFYNFGQECICLYTPHLYPTGHDLKYLYTFLY